MSRAELVEILADFHRNSCYPEAQPFELAHAAEKIAAALEGDAQPVAVKVLEDEAQFYESANGRMDGIPFKDVAHVCRIMAERIRATPPSPKLGVAVEAIIADASLAMVDMEALAETPKGYPTELSKRIAERRKAWKAALSQLEKPGEPCEAGRREGMRRAAEIARSPVITGNQIQIEACLDFMAAWDLGADDAIDGIVKSILSEAGIAVTD